MPASASIREAQRLSLQSSLVQWIIIAFSYVAVSHIASSFFAIRQWTEFGDGLVRAGVLEDDTFAHESYLVHFTKHALWVVAWCAFCAALLISCSRANTKCANCMSCSFSFCCSLKITLGLAFLILVASYLPKGAKQAVDFEKTCNPMLPEYSDLCSGDNRTRCMMCYDLSSHNAALDDDFQTSFEDDDICSFADRTGQCFPDPSTDVDVIDYCHTAGPSGTPFETPLPEPCVIPSFIALNCPTDAPFPRLNSTLDYEDVGAVTDWFQNRLAPDSWAECTGAGSETEYRIQAEERLFDEMALLVSTRVVHAALVHIWIQLVALALFVKVFVDSFRLWRESGRVAYETLQDVTYEAVPVVQVVKPYTTGGLIHQQELV